MPTFSSWYSSDSIYRCCSPTSIFSVTCPIIFFSPFKWTRAEYFPIGNTAFYTQNAICYHYGTNSCIIWCLAQSVYRWNHRITSDRPRWSNSGIGLNIFIVFFWYRGDLLRLITVSCRDRCAMLNILSFSTCDRVPGLFMCRLGSLAEFINLVFALFSCV